VARVTATTAGVIIGGILGLVRLLLDYASKSKPTAATTADKAKGETMATNLQDRPGKWFPWSELDPFGDRTPEQATELVELAAVLDAVRDRLGAPLKVTPHGGLNGPGMDAARVKQGRKLRSVGSRHRKGMAADVRAPGFTPDEVVVTVRQLVAEGQIPPTTAVAYPADGFTHIDTDGVRSWAT